MGRGEGGIAHADAGLGCAGSEDDGALIHEATVAHVHRNAHSRYILVEIVKRREEENSRGYCPRSVLADAADRKTEGTAGRPMPAYACVINDLRRFPDLSRFAVDSHDSMS